MKHIVVFGAGKSATCLIDYLITECGHNNWLLTVADQDTEKVKIKNNHHAYVTFINLNVEDTPVRKQIVKSSDLVISLLPPSLHFTIAIDCLEFAKHLLTASYIDENIKSLMPEIAARGILFLCEMGLDPGIDHMSAMQLIRRIRGEGGVITSFKSHCGGLVAPESDDNPWHYKISWNPRNVVLAGKTGGAYVEYDEKIYLEYEELFDPNRVVEFPELGSLAWYPNRDSISYMKLYELEKASTFIRTTLRYPEFCFGWKNIIDLKLTDETKQYETNGMTLQEFFQLHFNKYGFSDWIEKQLTARFTQTKQLLEKLQQLLAAEEEANEEEKKALQDFMMVDRQGELMDINLDEIKNKAAATVAGQMHEANLAMKQLFYLGMDDGETVINKGLCSAAEILQFAIERKLSLNNEDKDMIVMMHEIEYEKANKIHRLTSALLVKGDDSTHTAMAKTVGLPLGIAAKLILQEKISLSGLRLPVTGDIYEPVLQELKKLGVIFHESRKILS